MVLSPLLNTRCGRLVGLAICGFLLTVSPLTTFAAEIKSVYRFRLSDFSGPVPSLWAKIAVDEQTGEVYCLDLRQKTLSIFNGSGMRIHRFGEEVSLHAAVDLAVGENGDFYLLEGEFGGYALKLLSFRGVPRKTIRYEIPPEYRPFRPGRVQYRNGLLYLADINNFRVVMLDRDGLFLKGFDFGSKVAGLDEREKEKKTIGMEMTGFNVGPQGEILFTVSVLFAAFQVNQGGTLEGFGSAGSSEGKFGVVGGITSDRDGHIYVADRLRCKVLVFDRDRKFLTEFGGRGSKPDNLNIPNDIAINATNGLLYVSQAANEGVSVFQIIKERDAPDNL